MSLSNIHAGGFNWLDAMCESCVGNHGSYVAMCVAMSYWEEGISEIFSPFSSSYILPIPYVG